jgi:hypothetical protein
MKTADVLAAEKWRVEARKTNAAQNAGGSQWSSIGKPPSAAIRLHLLLPQIACTHSPKASFFSVIDGRRREER